MKRAEAEVVSHGGLEPALEILSRQGRHDAELRCVLERSPEPLEPGGGEDPVNGPEAVFDAEAGRGLAEDRPVNSGP